MRSLLKCKPAQQAFEWDPKYWDEIGEIAEPRIDHYAHRYPDGTEPATAEEYAAWLMGYVAQGGKIRYRRNDQRFCDSKFRIAYENVVIEPEYGAKAYTLVVRPGLKWNAPNGRGHIVVCEMDGFTTTNPSTIEEFSDTTVTPRTAADWDRHY